MAYMGTGTQIAIGKESNWGVAVADTLLLPFVSETIGIDAQKRQEESLLATKATSALDLMSLAAAGDVTMILKPEVAGFSVKAALGGTDTVVNLTGYYSHTIIAQTATGALPSYTVFANRKASVMKYSGMKVDSWKLDAKAGDYVRSTLSFKGKDEATGTITTVTPPSLKAYKMIGGTFTLGAALDITGFSLDYRNNLDAGIQTNTSGLYFSEPLHSARSINFTIDMPHVAASEAIRTTNYLTEALLATAVIHLESPSIITGAQKYRMDITMANVAVKAAKPNVSGAGLITIQLVCEATAVGATEPISIVVYDAQSGAY